MNFITYLHCDTLKLSPEYSAAIGGCIIWKRKIEMSAQDAGEKDIPASQLFDINTLTKMKYEKITLPGDVLTNFVNTLMSINVLLDNLQNSVHSRLYDDVCADVLYALVAVIRDKQQKTSKLSFCKELFKGTIYRMIQSTTYDSNGHKYFVFCDEPMKTDIQREMYEKFKFSILKPEMLADVLNKLMTLHIRLSKLNRKPIMDIRRKIFNDTGKLPKDEQTQIYFDGIYLTTDAILSLL